METYFLVEITKEGNLHVIKQDDSRGKLWEYAGEHYPEYEPDKIFVISATRLR